MYRAAILMLTLIVPSAAAAQQPCTTDARRVVNELYRHMLERGADPGSAPWVRQLESGRMTVRDVVRAIATSPEYTERFVYSEAGEGAPYERSVGRLYRHLLGRQPDEEGRRAFAALAQRSGVNPVIDRILASNEYNQQFGDWGVPGSGGVRYCAPNGAASRTQGPVGTSGEFIRVDSRNRWTDTGIDVRAGELLVFDADGSIRMSADANDSASPAGASSGRRATEAPFPRQSAGALIGRVNNRTFFIGDRRQMRAPANGRLFLGVNDDHLEDNAGDYQVTVTVD